MQLKVAQEKIVTPSEKEIYFSKPPRGKIPRKVYSSASLDENPKCKQHVLFLHAFTGCDTTSAFHNKGKLKFAAKFEDQKHLQDAAEIFKVPNQDSDSIYETSSLLQVL